MVRRARHVFVTGIGASWHAAIGAGTLFGLRGRPVYTVEAGELLHFTSIPADTVVIAISRTGRSIEIVQLLSKIRESGASLIGITNSPESPLATEAAVAIVLPAALDYAISVNTYSTLALGAGALAELASGNVDVPAFSLLSGALAQVEERLQGWREQISTAAWLEPGVPYYFLARGTSLASCHQSRLLWEEGAKSPATAMNTSGFRHGPQETVRAGMRFGIFIDPLVMRAQDLAVADDLPSLGASVMLIGQKLPEGSGHLVFQLPELPPNWQFAVDIIPVQMAAEQLARLAGVDCDSFRVCSYIVEDEHGLLKKK
jgi:glucosamine--fructose-6-phosphate aminotransferase (isomerizing)